MRHLPYLAVAALALACSDGLTEPGVTSPQFARGNPPPPPVTTTSTSNCQCASPGSLDHLAHESFQLTGLVSPDGATAWMTINPISVVYEEEGWELTITSVSPVARIIQTPSGITGRGVITAVYRNEIGAVDVTFDFATVQGTLIQEIAGSSSFSFDFTIDITLETQVEAMRFTECYAGSDCGIIMP